MTNLAQDPATKPRYLLLFGDASYDYKDRINNNTNLVPAYENNFALDPLSTYASDDFFGFLDDNEDINSGAITNYIGYWYRTGFLQEILMKQKILLIK